VRIGVARDTGKRRDDLDRPQQQEEDGRHVGAVNHGSHHRSGSRSNAAVRQL
jgi:hypothetical protein